MEKIRNLINRRLLYIEHSYSNELIGVIKLSWTLFTDTEVCKLFTPILPALLQGYGGLLAATQE